MEVQLPKKVIVGMEKAGAPQKIFRAKKTLYEEFVPDDLPHREKEIKEIMRILTDLIKEERSSNILCFGKTGTGKTVTAKLVADKICETGKKDGINLKHIYAPPEIDTESALYSFIGNEVTDSNKIPRKGFTTGTVFSMMKDAIDTRPTRVVLTIDEMDIFFKRHGDAFLYNLTRINSKLKKSTLCFIGISNDLKFTELFDPRVKSSLGAKEIIFHSYNANQLRDILQHRANIAFNDGAVEDGVLALCAALASQEHGDARKAIDLLRVAGEVAEEEERNKITEDDVRKAHSKIESDRTTAVISQLPLQSKAVLLSIILKDETGKESITSNEVYDVYRTISPKAGFNLLTKRRITDLTNELDMLGIITSRNVWKGRYGRVREIELNVSSEEVKNILFKDETLAPLAAYKEYVQKRIA